MRKFLFFRLTVALVTLSALAANIAGCSGSGQAATEREALAPPQPSTDLSADGRTNKPAQVRALPASGYSVEPLVTVGDEIPLLTGSFPGGSGHPKRTYGLPGICDGLGIEEHNGSFYVWLNHEIAGGNFSKYSNTISGQINGARVSLLKFTDKWEVVGGRNLIERVYDNTGLIGETTLNEEKTAVSQWGSVITRLCSSTLTGLYSNKPLFLTGEESTNGRAFAVDTEGNARVVTDALKFAYENLVPISKWSDETVLLLLDDTNDRYLVLYVGDRSADGVGLTSGTCYVGKVFVGGVPAANTLPLLPGVSNTVQWIEVPRTYDFDGAGPNAPQNLYTSTAPFYNWAGNVAQATQFKRPEDGHENPAVAGEVHFVTTGNVAGGSYDPYGRVWQLSLGSSPTAPASLKLTAVGSPTYFMNPDNVTADSFGQFWIQEDPSGTQNLMLGAGRRASIYRSAIGQDSYVRLFEVLQDTPPFIPPVTQTFAANPWETSGIVEVPGSSGQATVLFDTQAHGFPAPGYVEGGQLLIGYPTGTEL